MSFVHDTFTGTNGTLLSAHTGETGATWTQHGFFAGTLEIDTNRIKATDATNAIYYASGSPANADYDVIVKVRIVAKGASRALGPIGRTATGANTFYLYWINESNGRVQMYKSVAGSITQLGSDVEINPADGSDLWLKLKMRGTAIKGYTSTDGSSYTERISVTDTDSAISAAGKAGMWGANASGIHADEFWGEDSGDTTPPTLSSAQIPSAGTTLTATLSESGCTPSSGSGGFTLSASGGAVTVSSWVISSTTLTLTLSRTITPGETVTYSYDRSTTTDDIADAASNFLANFTGASVTNNSSADVTAPTLSSPTATVTGTTTATVGVTTDEANGTLYAVVTTSSTAPSAAQVKAGQDHTGSAAVFDDNQAIGSTGAKTFNATGLSANTTYYAHFMHEDAATNQSTVSSTSAFITRRTVSIPDASVALSPYNWSA